MRLVFRQCFTPRLNDPIALRRDIPLTSITSCVERAGIIIYPVRTWLVHVCTFQEQDTLNRSSRVMPGFLGTPAGMIMTSAPFKASPNCSSPA